MVRVPVLVAAIAAIALAGAGCGDEDGSASPQLNTVDERAGLIAGVGIGSSKREVARALGPYLMPAQAYPSEPADAGDDGSTAGPWSVVTGPHHLGPGGKRGEQVTLRYPGAAFFVLRDRVFGFLVSAERAMTQGGVHVGDRLQKVLDRYPRFRCEGASRSDTSAIQEPACSGFVRGGRWVYFGGDPIQSITVMEDDRDHYAY